MTSARSMAIAQKLMKAMLLAGPKVSWSSSTLAAAARTEERRDDANWRSTWRCPARETDASALHLRCRMQARDRTTRARAGGVRTEVERWAGPERAKRCEFQDARKCERTRPRQPLTQRVRRGGDHARCDALRA